MTCIFRSVKGESKKLSDTLHADGYVERSHFLILKVSLKRKQSTQEI